MAGSSGKTTPKPSATELSSFHSAAAGQLMTSDAMIKVIKRIFDLLLNNNGLENCAKLWTHRQMGFSRQQLCAQRREISNRSHPPSSRSGNATIRSAQSGSGPGRNRAV